MTITSKISLHAVVMLACAMLLAVVAPGVVTFERVMCLETGILFGWFTGLVWSKP